MVSYFFNLIRAASNSNKKKTSNSFSVFSTPTLTENKKSLLPLEELEVSEEDYQLLSPKKLV